MSARNNVDLEQDPRSIIAARVLDAPRELVWTAWTKPEHLAQWWGPDGRDYQNRITFDEIVRPERIRYHHGGGDDAEPVQFRTTVTFENLAGNRTQLTLHAVFPSAAARERVIKQYGADKGAVQTLARLADYLAKLSA